MKDYAMTTTPVPLMSPTPVVAVETLRYLGLDPNKPETRALVLLANRYRLDPLLGHIALIQTRFGARVYITRDGMLEVAHKSGQLDGIVVDEERRSSKDDGYTARVSVWRKDCGHPFTYGAQCKDSEPLAKGGNGPEMALARAERRALRRAFNIPVDEHLGEDHVEAVDVPAIDVDVSVSPSWDTDPSEAVDPDPSEPLVEHARRMGVTAGPLLVQARRLAGELGTMPPRSLEDLEDDSELMGLLRDWLNEGTEPF